MAFFVVIQGEEVKAYDAISGWGSGKVFLEIIFKIQQNMLNIFSNTLDMLFGMYSNTFLQKNVIFLHVRHFTLIKGPF